MAFAPVMRWYAIVALCLGAALNAPAAAAETYAKLFGTSEVRSSELTMFTHWTGMIERMRATPEPLRRRV